MNLFKIYIALLFTISFSFNANSTTNVFPDYTMAKVEGGPRTVIQAMTGAEENVTVLQPTATNLYVTIKDSNGDTAIEAETQEENTMISIQSLEPGDYVVETVDDYGDYQEFSIAVE
ncbi:MULTISPECIES: hypothetical protein [unclassified Aureispira]|uniref:hypothetical protein n=1 Tax=unclassified Aureispira TaxID=2649989 RepID=UPI000699217F|nr:MULTISPECIES: hypothetical protein [unclassified Aureispira]WMX13466.1 hypothetical protein QP953_21700 [Aureispira sp. CCB-E]